MVVDLNQAEDDGAQGGRSLVWVQRRNGTWWPGRVMGPTEITPPPSSSSSSSPSTCKTPVMLLGKDNHSVVDWYNLEKSMRIKAFRCDEFNGCIKEAESSGASTFSDITKYACRKDAILHALELEKKEHEKTLKRGGELKGETICRAKRTKCTYFPINSQSSKVSISRIESDNSTFVSGNEIKKQNEINNSCIPEVKLTIFDLNESYSKEIMINNTTEITVISSSQEIENSGEVKSGENLFDTCSIDSGYTNQENEKDTTLIDVNVSVQKVYRGEHVPFICLVSRRTEKPIIGHPIDIEVLPDSSEIYLPCKDNVCTRLFKDDRNRILKLVWKTSRRTPVCYIPNPQSCPNLEDSGKKLKKHKTLGYAIKHKGLGNEGCVTVKHIFSYLIEAVKNH